MKRPGTYRCHKPCTQIGPFGRTGETRRPSSEIGAFFRRKYRRCPDASRYPRYRPDAPIVVKHHAGAFRETGLNAVLDDAGTDEILVCGMQTRNGVGLTAISNKAARYQTAILSDGCTAETKTVHAIALSGFGDIVPVIDSADALN